MDKKKIIMIQKITSKPPRVYLDYSLYFLTFCTFQRKPILHEYGISELLIENIKFYGKRLKEVIAYTIMPDHIHLLVEVIPAENISSFLRDFKKYTSREIKRLLLLNPPHIWQRGTMDHFIRLSNANEDLENHIQYLFYNSWKHLKIRPQEFKYHNFKEIVARGWLEDDFCDFDESDFEYHKIYEI